MGSRYVAAFLALLLFAAGHVQAQLRIVDYNTGGAARPGLGTLLEAIGVESLNGVSKPLDVLTLQEQSSGATTTQAIVNLLNSIYGSGVYARSTLEGQTNGAGRQELIYNTTTVQLVAQATASTVSGTTGPTSQTMRYELRPIGYDAAADFFVYVSHYKASSGEPNETRRQVEAGQVRANADALGEGAHVVYTGDFNIYRSSEPMWTTLTRAGAGQAFDPVNRVGSWSNNSAFKDVHTQSPATTASYDGQVTGGMDDRFDFQLVSGEFLDGEGLSYLAGSYHAFGNTGTHSYNGAISSGSAAALQARLPGYTLAQASAVLDALTKVSDHLPVVAQYQLPAMMGVQVAAVPARIVVGGTVSLAVTVSNLAPVLAANGADELDYILSGGGAAGGAFADTDLALGGGNTHLLTLASGAVGAQSGSVTAHATSEAAAHADFSSAIGYLVVDHAEPLFGNSADPIHLSLDFGTVSQDADAGTRPFSIENWTSSLGAAAALDLDEIFGPAGSPFTTDLAVFSNLAAGSAREFHVGMMTGMPGTFDETYRLVFSDEDLPGAMGAGTLTLRVTGQVVPEPGTMALLCGGLTVVGWLRRRQLT